MLMARYLFVAGLAYGIDLGGYILLLKVGLSPILSNIIVKIIAALFGFYAHRYFTYSILENDDIGKHAIKYFGLALIYTPVATFFLYCMMLIWPNPVYAKVTVDIMLFILVFWVTSTFTFARKKTQKDIQARESLE